MVEHIININNVVYTLSVQAASGAEASMIPNVPCATPVRSETPVPVVAVEPETPVPSETPGSVAPTTPPTKVVPVETPKASSAAGNAEEGKEPERLPFGMTKRKASNE